MQTFLNQMEGDETALIYDEKAEVIRVYFKTEKKRGCVRVHLGTGIAWDAPSSTHIPLYVGGLTYSTVPGSTTILVEEGYRLEGSRGRCRRQNGIPLLLFQVRMFTWGD